MSAARDDPYVALGPVEYLDARLVGLARVYGLTRDQIRRDYKSDRERNAFVRIADHANGAVVELAVCRHVGATWPAHVEAYGYEPDLVHNGLRHEIRATTHDGGHLLVYRNDDVDLCVLGVVYGRLVRIAGYCLPTFARRPEFARGSCWWVPQTSLTPLPEGGVWPKDLTQEMRRLA